MKKTKSVFGLFVICFAIVLALAVWAGINPPVSVSAEMVGSFVEYTVEDFRMEMKIAENRTISVKERLTVNFPGRNGHGIIRDFPLGGGIVYNNISAECETSTDFSPYFKSDDLSFLSYYLGGEGYVTGRVVYVITYDMKVPALKEEGYLPLNVLGYGWQSDIDFFEATIELPGALTAEPILYSGEYGTTGNEAEAAIRKTGANEYRVTAEYLGCNYYYGGVAPGITVDFSFEKGVLSTDADLSILYAFLAGVVVLGVACIIRFVCYRRPLIVKPVSVAPPERVDPFLMGKLIDDKVDKEDYGALFFYLASKGYLHIDMTEDAKNPTVYKSQKPFGEDEPKYCKEMYDALFSGRESVNVKDLSNHFYTTADRMKTQVAESAGKSYRGTAAPVFLLCILAVLVLGGFALLFTMLTVSFGVLWWLSFVGCAFAFLPPALGVNVFIRRRYKWKKVSLIFTVIGLFLAGVLLGFLFCLIPAPAFGWGTPFTLVVLSASAGLVAGDCVTPTKTHAEKLGRILGFKQFIEFTERDKIEFMLKEDPELYYNILPYAQVLGVTDAWTEKFKGLKISMPSYCSYSSPGVFDCIVWYSLFSSFNRSVSTNMTARPSPKGGYSGGIGKGGFGGGFGGGGGRGF